MAIYHCSIKIISRAGGRSAVASAAYRSGEKLMSEETGILHDFTRKSGVICCEIMLPENAPLEYADRSTLWNDVQKVETRSDARFAREIEVALPKEMDRESQIECVQNYIRDNFISKGMIADWALHDKGDGNPHAHIMLTCRGIGEDGKWDPKTKSVYANDRDEQGRPVYDPAKPSYDPRDRERTSEYRIPVLDENGNQKYRERSGKGKEMLWVRINIPANDWNDRKYAEIWRASWAEHCNRYLSEDQKIDHRSYVRQGIDKEPTIHEGVTARQMELNGNTSERCSINREIRERNAIRKQIRELAKEITNTIVEKARDILGRFKEFRGSFGDTEGTGRNADHSGKPAGRDRRTADGKKGVNRTAGRIRRLKRTADETDREIESTDNEIEVTDQRIAKLRQQTTKTKVSIHERLERLKRRRNDDHDGGNAGSDRGISGGPETGEGKELKSTRDDIESFLGKLASSERSAEKKREDRIAERADREALRERSHSDTERQTDSTEHRPCGLEQKADGGHGENQTAIRRRGRHR